MLARCSVVPKRMLGLATTHSTSSMREKCQDEECLSSTSSLLSWIRPLGAKSSICVDELYIFREVGEYLMPFFEHVHDFLCEEFQDLERPIGAYTKYRFPDLFPLSCMTWDQKLSSGYCSRPLPLPSSSSASQKVGLHFRTVVGFRPTSFFGLCYWPLELGVCGWLQVDVIGSSFLRPTSSLSQRSCSTSSLCLNREFARLWVMSPS